LPADRRLPLAFLGRKLSDLLNTPFEELYGTPGIGKKKIDSFVKLLARAANTDPAELPIDFSIAFRKVSNTDSNGTSANGNGFSPSSVSEILWGQWCATVVEHGLQDETLGRLAPSLRNMTKVIWDKRLGDYVEYTLEEMRSMKSYGEKRISAILEVFHSAHVLTANMGEQSHLTVRIVPTLIDKVEQWIGQVLQQPGAPSEDEILENFVQPLLAQVRADATQQIADLARNRLGIDGPIASVRQVARNMGLTRARVYQLLNEINDIMNVRWPKGRHQVYELSDKIQTEIAQAGSTSDMKRFFAAVELFYPGCRRGAAGPLEQAPMLVQQSPVIRSMETTA